MKAIEIRPRVATAVLSLIPVNSMLLGAVLTLLVFWPTYFAYFTGEDFIFILFAGSGKAFYEPVQELFYRPLPNLLWKVDFNLWNLHAGGYHLTNIVLHAFNSILVAFLIHRTVKIPLLTTLSCVIFAIHPIHVEAVVWLSGRPDLLATCFFLLGLLFGFRYFETKNWKYLIPSLLFYMVALLSKESALGLPFVTVVWYWLLTKKSNPQWNWFKELKSIIPFLLVLLLYILIRLSVLGKLGGYQSQGRDIINILWNVTFGFWLPNLFPVNFESFGWLSVVGLAVALTLFYIWLLSRIMLLPSNDKQELATFFVLGVFFIYITSIPILNNAPVAANLSQSRIFYLPSIGFCLILASFLKVTLSLPKSKKQNLEITSQNQSKLGVSFLNVSKPIIYLGVIYVISSWIAIWPWIKAGEVTKSTFQLLNTQKSIIAPGDTIYFEGLPDSFRGAYVWRNGLDEASKIFFSPTNEGFYRTNNLIIDYRKTERGKIWFYRYNFDSSTLQTSLTFSYNLTNSEPQLFPSPQNSKERTWSFLECSPNGWTWDVVYGNVECQKSKGTLFDNQKQSANLILKSPQIRPIVGSSCTFEIDAYVYYNFRDPRIRQIVSVSEGDKSIFEQSFEMAADGKNHRYNLILPNSFKAEKLIQFTISAQDVKSSILWRKISLICQ